jgi:SAM-dependent methyltransferase
MSDFATRDPASPAFWDERFERAFMPWDRRGVPQALHTFVARQGRKLATLIPGCGSGYELAHLSEAGWPVTAIDFSAAAVARARSLAGPWAGRIEQADFFTWTPPRELDFIYERAFLCALPRARWEAVAARWAALLTPGALLGGFFFIDDQPKGPPFGAAPDQVAALLAPWFTRLEDLPVTDSIPVFEGKERWQVWQRI